MSNIISESSTRIKTGIVLVIALLIIGFIDSITLTWLLFGALMIIALKESMNLFKIDDDKIYIYAVAIWIIAYFYPKPEDLIFVVGVLFAAMLAYTQEFNKNLFLPLMYPIASFLFLLSLYFSYGMGALLWLLVVVAGTDVGAYFVGKSMGSLKFCATSPNKTLEGVFGGVIIAAILGMIFAPEEIGFLLGLFISLAVAIASVFGDLFESYLKREADVKDSGDILPGHGGILDRTDGYLFGGIVMLFLLRFFA
ncbi:phosphatidate cytidylyltransferase [Arcobacter sp. 15-2]|uniref:phosphatidate cytidylyltransferase n=1 Tax=Arcobacter sp. 15-2 TaxID=3374109 RepID=UPI00399C77B3